MFVEDMGRHIRLAQALEDGTIAHMTRIQKLPIAYELVSTVAALHRAKIVIRQIHLRYVKPFFHLIALLGKPPLLISIVAI